MHDLLKAALREADTARQAYHAQCLAVWHALETVEPALANSILALGFDETAAAQWVCQPNRDGDAPAALVAAGRSADVQAVIERIAHGFAA